MPSTRSCAVCSAPHPPADEVVAEAFPQALLDTICGDCLAGAHSASSLVDDDYDRDRFFEQVRRLDRLVGRLPVHGGWRREIFRRHVPLEDLIEAVKIAGDVPRIKCIRERHGSWAAALAEASVAPDSRENVFGIQSRATDGHMCFSVGELVIDDWLTHHDIPHEREPAYPVGDLRGDFRVGDTIIEFFGMAGVPEYDAIVARKRQVAREHGMDVVELTRQDLERWSEAGAARLAAHLGVELKETLPPPPSVGTEPVPSEPYETTAQRRTRMRLPAATAVGPRGWESDPFGVGAVRYTDGRVWTRWIKTPDGRMAVHSPVVSADTAALAWTFMDDEDRRGGLYARAEALAGGSAAAGAVSPLLEWYLAWMDAGENHVPKFIAEIYADGGEPWGKIRPWRTPYKGAAELFAAAGDKEAELAVWFREWQVRGTEYVVTAMLGRGYRPDEVRAGMAVPR